MVPRGSSYLMTAETFLKGRPLNVTDLDFAPDGSMYLVTGGRKTQSALYRVRYVGVGSREATASRWELASDRFARNSRHLRRELEADLAQPPSEKCLVRVWNVPFQSRSMDSPCRPERDRASSNGDVARPCAGRTKRDDGIASFDRAGSFRRARKVSRDHQSVERAAAGGEFAQLIDWPLSTRIGFAFMAPMGLNPD